MTALSVRDLTISLPREGGLVPLVHGVSFDVEPGRILGIAGESGSGKTISTLSVVGLLPQGSKVEGSILLGDRQLLGMSERSLRAVRGSQVGVVFQDPLSSLHPMLTIGAQVTDHLRKHLRVSRKSAYERAIDLLRRVRLPSPQRLVRAYPHQLSGGMRQRVAIAAALACNPQVLIADEPTTALDVTVQAGILELLDDLRTETGIATIVITHDLGVLSSIADDMVIFQSGRIVEAGPGPDVFQRPRHAYTRELLAALPDVEHHGSAKEAS